LCKGWKEERQTEHQGIDIKRISQSAEGRETGRPTKAFSQPGKMPGNLFMELVQALIPCKDRIGHKS
jgi:hypothetical protein